MYKISVWTLIIFVAAISVFSVIICAIDKSKARKGKRRVSEETLMVLSALGGALFMFVTMILTRHKTRHAKFMILLPLFVILHALIAYLIIV